MCGEERVQHAQRFLMPAELEEGRGAHGLDVRQPSVQRVQDVESILGPVPGDVFNHLFATAALPGVFEGQATSSLVISLGRPFLQLD